MILFWVFSDADLCIHPLVFMLAEILLLLAVAYSVMIIAFGVAVFTISYATTSTYRPTVSIVIAARNEEQNIRRCMDSIVRLSYPVELLEAIVVDDGSDDGTGEIVREYSKPFHHIRLLTATPGTNKLRGKTNAIAQGIEASHGDILLFTDADCVVPVHWVEGTVKYYSDSSIGVVAGFTKLRAKNWFEAIQTIDWLVLFSVAAATVRLRYPVTAVGNNLSVRRDAYDRVGGYQTIPFSVTEDYALFHAICRHAQYQARFPIDIETLVESEPCKDAGDLFRQKTRWFTGGKNMDVRSLLIFTLPYCLNALLIGSVFFLPIQTTILALALKVAVDLFLALASISTFRQWSLLKHFPAFELYYIVYVLLFPLVVLAGKEVVWKERKL